MWSNDSSRSGDLFTRTGWGPAIKERRLKNSSPPPVGLGFDKRPKKDAAFNSGLLEFNPSLAPRPGPSSRTPVSCKLNNIQMEQSTNSGLF